MSLLYNFFSKKKLKFNICINHEPRLTLSFYKYCNIFYPQKTRNMVYTVFHKLKIFGRIYISQEGINAQISILYNNYHILKNFLHKLHKDLKGIRINRAVNNKKSFFMLQVKVRNKIITDNILHNHIHFNNIGIYLNSYQVNNLLKNSNAVFIDMRNSYEYNIGHFQNAINITGLTFRDQLNNIISELKYYSDKKIILYCTGGIRCEKATAWIKYHNFKQVYQLEGGILNYFHESRRKRLPIKFKGKNFVFDNRIIEEISHHIFTFCENCGNYYDNYINCNNNFCHRLFMQCKLCYIKHVGYCSINCKMKYVT